MSRVLVLLSLLLAANGCRTPSRVNEKEKAAQAKILAEQRQDFRRNLMALTRQLRYREAFDLLASWQRTPDFAGHKNWFDKHATALKKAKQYNDLVASTWRKFKRKRIQRRLKKCGFTLKTIKQKSGDNIRIATILRHEVLVVVSRYDRDGTLEPVGTESIPLGDIVRYGVFHDLALIAWGKENVDELKLLRGCHEFYFRPPMGKTILENLGYDENAKFLLEEFDFILPCWTPEYIDTMREKLRNTESKKERFWLYKQIKKMAGESKEFKAQEEEISREAARQ